MSAVVREDVVKKVILTICKFLKLDAEKVTAESDLATLGADSLNVTDIVMEIEEAYAFEMPEDDMQKVKTVNDIVNFTMKRIKGKV